MSPCTTLSIDLYKMQQVYHLRAKCARRSVHAGLIRQKPWHRIPASSVSDPSSTSASASPNSPQTPGEQINQAAQAVELAYRDGVKLQRLELLLPLIGATDLDDWPGGIRQQFKAAQPLVESLLRKLKSASGLQGSLVPEMWDDGDAVVAWRGANLAAVVFPNAEALPKVQALAQQVTGPTLIINPQWTLQFTSELGFGAQRQAAQSFISSFTDTYHFKQARIQGMQIRVVHAYPSAWGVFTIDARGRSTLLAQEEQQPSYQRLEELLSQRPDANSNKSLMDRLRDELKFSIDSLNKGP